MQLAAAEALVEGRHVRLMVLPTLVDGALLNKVGRTDFFFWIHVSYGISRDFECRV